jgi:pyruvate dehydrogenase (quinone)
MGNVAELLVETLSRAGVKRVLGVVGDSLNGVTDVIRARDDMEWIGVRHEEVAAFAAGGQAYLTGNLAVCAGSCGPGHVHLINGLYDCARSRVPVLAIAAHVPSTEIGSSYFQETRPELLFRDCSSYCETISHPSQAPRILEIAMQVAIGQRAVAVVVLPGDVAVMKAETNEPRVVFRRAQPAIRPSDEEITTLANALNEAEKVTILGGAGCAGAHEELIAVAELLKAPIVHALRGKEFIEYDNPFDVGMTGLLGFSSGYRAMESCDVLLMLGTDFPYTQFYPKKAWIAQVDTRPEQLGRRTHLNLGLLGDVKETLRALRPLLRFKEERKHLDDCLKHYRKARETLDDLAIGKPGHKPIHPQYLTRMVDSLAADDAIFAGDVGTPSIWVARYLTMNGKRRLLGSWVHGSMAAAVPLAIGAQLACPGRQVITLSGDGGLTMLMGDLLSLVQHKLPVKMVVYNNSSLAFVELEMKAGGVLPYGTDLVNPNLAQVAEAMGIRGYRVEDPVDVEPALKEAFAHNGPALVDVVVNRQELSIPPSITLQQAAGFNLYMLKAILSGRADEILDLAKTNFLGW